MRHPRNSVGLPPRPSCQEHRRKLGVPFDFHRRRSPAFPLSLPLKLRLLHRALQTFCEPHFERPLRATAEQAARLALATGYPLLTFPELFRELAIPAMANAECQVLARIYT